MEKFSLHLRHPPQKKLQHQCIVYTYPVGDLGDYALSAAMSEVYACSLFKPIECPEAADMGKFNQFISCQDICCC